MKKKKDLFLIVSLCLAAACSIGIYLNTFGIFFSPIAEALNEKRGNVAAFYTIMMLSNAIFSAIIPGFITNRNFKKIYLAGIAGSVCSLILMANSSSLFMLYAGSLLLGASFSTYFMVVITTVINCSFKENVGTITGFVFSFSGLAGALVSPLLSYIIGRSGWQAGFYVLSAAPLILCLPAVFADIRIEQDQPSENETGPVGFNYHSSGYILLVVMLVCYMFIPSMAQHFPGIALSKGFADTVGPLMVSSSMIGNIVFKLIAGILSDRLGSLKALSIMSAVTLTGIAILSIAKNPATAFLAAFLYGAIYSITAILASFRIKELCGIANYKKAYSIASLAGNIANALSIAAIGYIYDFFTSYDPALLIAISLDVIALILAILANKLQKTK